MQKLNIRDLSKESILNAVKLAAASAEPGEWIEGGMGWNNEVWQNPAYPTAAELDAVAPGNPVLLPRMDGHMVWVNSAAFAACGINELTKNPNGGEFMRNNDGSLQGCASDTAADILRAALPKRTETSHEEALLLAQQRLFAYGVTSVNDMCTTTEDIQRLKILYEAGKYKLRTPTLEY